MVFRNNLSLPTAPSTNKKAQHTPCPSTHPLATSHILQPDKLDTGDTKRGASAADAPPPRPSAPPYTAPTASRNVVASEFLAGNSNWYTNPLDVWGRTGSGGGGGGKSVQFAAGTEHYAASVSFQPR